MNLFELFIKIGAKDEASGTIQKLSAWTVAKGQLMADGIKAGTKALYDFSKQAINSFAEYEQLAGGAQKIFDQMDYSKIATDANNAYKELGLSANQYLAVINDVGATFAATMGDEAGYEAAKTGLKAISDYASGTGKNVNELSQKFTLITRSTSSYQSIADQFSGILPATSAGFLEQAQAAGILSDSYKQLTEVPIAEYQDAVSKMLEQGVGDLGLANNTMDEAFSTLSGSLAMAKGAWSNFVTGLADDSADLESKIDNLVTSAGSVYQNIEPRILQVVDGMASFANLIVPKIIDTIGANAPMLLEAAVSIVGTLAGALISNLPTLLAAALELVVSLAESLADNTGAFVDGVIQIITAVAGAILNNLPTLTVAVVEIIVNLAAEIVMHIPEILEATAEVVLAVIGALFAALGSFLEVGGAWIDSLNAAIAAKVSEVVAAAQELVSGFISTLAAKFAEIYEQAGEWVEENLITPISDKVEEFINIGQSVVDKIREGISNAWGSLTSWFAGIWDSLFGNLRVNVGVGGIRGRSHASGLDYVPYNGYPAVLHRGEAVLTSREADNWRKGGTGNAAAQPIILNLELKTELDGATVARKTYKYYVKEADYRGQQLIKA